MTEPKRDWRKIKYYPVSIEKLQQASMRENAFFRFFVYKLMGFMWVDGVLK